MKSADIAIEGAFLTRVDRSADIKRCLQERLDAFPRRQDNGDIAFREFSAFLIRPRGEPANQLNHLLMPRSLILMSDPDETTTDKLSLTVEPEFRLLADVNSNELLIALRSHRGGGPNTVETHTEIRRLADCHLTQTLWDSFTPVEHTALAERGFSAELPDSEWGAAIHTDPNRQAPYRLPIVDTSGKHAGIRQVRELDLKINRLGQIGVEGSYVPTPDLYLQAIANNDFFYDEETPVDDHDGRLFEYGDVHLHSLCHDPSPLEQAVADIVGQDLIRRTPSVPDIYSRRSTGGLSRALTKAYLGKEKHCMNSFCGIAAVDAAGNIDGIRYLNFYDADLKTLARLSDNAYKEMYDREYPDPKVIAELYRFVDSVMIDEFGEGTSAEHVGVA